MKKVYFRQKKILLFFSLCLIFSNSLSSKWFHSSGDYKSNKYSNDSQITANNIKDLKMAWDFSNGLIKSNTIVQASPIYTGSKIISISMNSIYALNPKNGDLIWRVYIDENSEFQLDSAAKGISYSPTKKSIFVPTNEGILELNESDGSKVTHYNSGASALPPILNKNKLIIATRWNGVKAFDINSKEIVWQFETNKNGYQSHIWSGFSLNNDIGLAFIVTGSSGGITGWYRNDPNLDNTLIAIDVETGKMRWSFQQIDHDLWDLDLVGNPMSFNVTIDSKEMVAVVALTKTGDVIYLDANSGKPIFDDSFEMVKVPQSNVPNELTATYQKKFKKPEPYTNTYINLDDDFSHLSGENLEYVKQKIRRAKSGFFLPPSLDDDLILYGLHGGAEWPGGSINFSKKNPSLIVPYNRDPWIIRTYYRDNLYRAVEVFYSKYDSFLSSFSSEISSEQIYEQNCSSCHERGQAPDKSYLGNLDSKQIYDAISIGTMALYAKELTDSQKNQLSVYLSNEKVKVADTIFQSLPFTPKNMKYKQNCQSCHGPARRGFHENEGTGDKYFPPLVGVTLTKKRTFIEDYKEIKTLHLNSDISYEISADEHKEIFDSFHRYDSRLKKMGLLSSRGFWQVLLDSNDNPATKPPWGGIAKIDLINGNKVWDIPFGALHNEKGELIANGLRNFGGLISTKTGLIFATGTSDSKAYAFDTNGLLVWSDTLPYVGSSPPITYTHDNCQYVIFTATGGKWYDNSKNGDKLVAYKLDNCNA